MSPITAWQHIYSNVEKEQSPQGRGGFQTLFYTRAGLSEMEIEEMEGRLLYFASTVEPVKRLFFTISSGKGVVAQIVFLPTPDQFGRGGRYLAHSLVFAPEALAQFEVDPFRVFAQFQFLTTVDQALQRGDFHSGDIPPASLDLPAQADGDIKAAADWPAPELIKLALLALRADRQAQQREAITITGRPDQIEHTLAAAFLAAPPSLRRRCSFDTYFYRCNLVATYFWAIGLPEPPVSVKFVHVDGPTRQVRGQAPTQPESAYERWVVGAIGSGRLADIARFREQGYAIGEWLDGRAYTLAELNAAPAPLIAQVLEASPQSVQDSLRRGVAQKLPPELVDRAARHIFKHGSSLELFKQLRQGFEISQLVAVLYDSYLADRFQPPSWAEVKALEGVLNKAEHRQLRLVFTYWDNPRKQLPKALEWAAAEDYRQFASLALNFRLLSPLELLVPGKADMFLDLVLPDGINDLPALVETLIEIKAFTSLERLNHQVFRLERKALLKVAKLIDNRLETPETFQQAVAKAMEALPPEGGVKGMLKSVWGRVSGK